MSNRLDWSKSLLQYQTQEEKLSGTKTQPFISQTAILALAS